MEVEFHFPSEAALIVEEYGEEYNHLLPLVGGIIEANPAKPIIELPAHIQRNWLVELIGLCGLEARDDVLSQRSNEWLASVLHVALHFEANEIADKLKVELLERMGLSMEWRVENAELNKPKPNLSLPSTMDSVVVKELPLERQLDLLRVRIGVKNDFGQEYADKLKQHNF
jgi:hypothetical protein